MAITSPYSQQTVRQGANGDEYYYNGQWITDPSQLQSAWDYYGGQMPLKFVNYDAAVSGSNAIVSGYNGNSMLASAGSGEPFKQVGGMADGLLGNSGSNQIFGISDGSNWQPNTFQQTGQQWQPAGALPAVQQWQPYAYNQMPQGFQSSSQSSVQQNSNPFGSPYNQDWLQSNGWAFNRGLLNY